MEKKTSALRKRQEINKANKMMFAWIAAVSAVVGIAAVLGVFLLQKIMFQEKVLSAKSDTETTLQGNLKTVKDLSDNIRVLSTNEALLSIRLNDSDSALQPVLDALPATANGTALGSSLQKKLLNGVTGVVIETINVQPAVDSGSVLSSTSQLSSATTNADPQKISFSFSVSTTQGNELALQQVLERIEKSIRPFTITNLTIEAQGKKIVMTITGNSYYKDAQKVQLTEKVVKP